MSTKGKVRIETDCIGRGKVFLNGEDISNYVNGFTIIGDVGSLNTVELRLVAGVEIDTETQQLITYHTEVIPALLPTDIIVVTAGQKLSKHVVESLWSSLHRQFPNNKVVVLDEAMCFHVDRKSCQPTPPEAPRNRTQGEYVPLELETFAIKYNEAKRRGLI
jgi:hypothetical protein